MSSSIDRKPPPLRDLGLLAMLALGWSAWHWLHIGGLLRGDNVRWMAEASRAAAGEVIYRDFSSMYPPFGVLLTSILYRAFGATFAVTNAMLDGLSLLLVVAVWGVARRLFDERTSLACAVVFLCMGATNAGNFALFSLSLYTPAILCGGIGIALFAMGALDVLAGGLQGRAPRILIACGLTLALLSKLEHAIAGIIGFGVLALGTMPTSLRGQQARTWAAAFLGMSAAVVAPTLLVYGLLARRAGVSNLLSGVAGYGVAGQYCPFWPTGLGVLGALSSLGEAAALVSVVALAYRVTRSGQRRGRPWLLVVVTLSGVSLWLAHLPYALENFSVAQPGLKGASLIAGYLLSFSGLLLPVMWSAILLAVTMGVQLVRQVVQRKPCRSLNTSVLLLLATSAALASRGLFGHMFGNVTIVHQSSYVLLILACAYLVLLGQALVDLIVEGHGLRDALRLVKLPELGLPPSPGARWLLLVIAAIFTLPRVAKVLVRAPAPLLRTLAGKIYLDDNASREAYAYVVANTRPGDRILESPIGGGLAFAARRRYATFSMQFYGLLTPERLMQVDADLVRASPPPLVIAQDAANLGAAYGVCCRCACVFPRLVWRSDRLACDPDRAFEALEFVKTHYMVAVRFGGYVALVPNAAKNASRSSEFENMPRPANCGACSGTGT